MSERRASKTYSRIGNGNLPLPREQIDTLGLPKASVTEVTLADGQGRDVPLYEA